MKFECAECGAIFDAEERATIKECVGEFWGAPAYEYWNACPYCKSTEIMEYEACPCCDNCKHLYTEYGCDLCDIHGNTLENQEEECCDDYEPFIETY